MDLLVGAKKIIVTTNHVNKKGEAKLVEKCTYPITSNRIVDMIITDFAVFEQRNGIWHLTELMKDTSLEQVQEHTEFKFEIDESVRTNQAKGVE